MIFSFSSVRGYATHVSSLIIFLLIILFVVLLLAYWRSLRLLSMLESVRGLGGLLLHFTSVADGLMGYAHLGLSKGKRPLPLLAFRASNRLCLLPTSGRYRRYAPLSTTSLF